MTTIERFEEIYRSASDAVKQQNKDGLVQRIHQKTERIQLFQIRPGPQREDKEQNDGEKVHRVVGEDPGEKRLSQKQAEQQKQTVRQQSARTVLLAETPQISAVSDK